MARKGAWPGRPPLRAGGESHDGGGWRVSPPPASGETKKDERMSEKYVFRFHFLLKRDLPSDVITAFQAVAHGEKARPEGLSTFPQFMRTLLMEPDSMVEYCVCEPTPFARHYLRFVVVLHEDLYVNGGFKLLYEVFDFVDGDFLFCMEWTYGSDALIRHYCKERDGLIMLELERASLPSQRPLQETDFSLKFTRVTAEERKAVLQIPTRY